MRRCRESERIMANENTNPQVESHLTKLAEVCRESLRGGGEPDSRIVDQLSICVDRAGCEGNVDDVVHLAAVEVGEGDVGKIVSG